jgi:hypothetical protein
MSFTIAIQPDEIIFPNGSRQSFSDRWIAKAQELGHEVRIVDVYRNDIIEHLRECDGFMWRFPHAPFPRLFAKRLLAVAEKGLGLVVFPDCNTSWHYDDKVAQRYLLEAAGIPTAKTWIFWKREDALNFCRSANYSLVIKLAGGASSQNVRLLKDFGEAEYWLNQLFYSGVFSLERPTSTNLRVILKRLRPSARLLLKGLHPNPGFLFELQKNYLMVQEFLPNNPHDTRVTVIGNRAFAFRRFNRPDDFRASGSGNFDTDYGAIDLGFIRLGFKTARALGTQSVAIDGLYRDNECVTTEISYTYASWVVHECPGHWELEGDAESGRLIWKTGQMWPEDAIMEDFLARLKSRKKASIS